MTINCKGKLLDLTQPRVMGILNVTPDSFYDGGRYTREDAILKRVEIMLEDGADFLDIGGYSSRPGASDISEEEELQRTAPAVAAISKRFPEAIISVDTFRSKIARACIESGAALINDISGGTLDEEMIATAGALQVPYIMMHMKGTPQNMKQLAHYDDLLKDITHFFSRQIALARDHRINDIIIDPGFGFAKTADQNYELLANLEHLKILDRPILVGVSRKSMIWKHLETTPEEALNGTTVLNTIALTRGATILRVHDVKEARECISLFQKTQSHVSHH